MQKCRRTGRNKRQHEYKTKNTRKIAQT